MMPPRLTTAVSVLSSSLETSPSTVRLGNAEVVNATSGNVARDTAVQINGHVAGKIYNINMYYQCKHALLVKALTLDSKKLVICHQRSVVTDAVSHQRQGIVQFKDGPEQARPVDGNRTLSRRQSQDITLQSSSTGDKDSVHAIFRPGCSRNYISARIVRRFDLKSYEDPTADISRVDAGDRSMTPTRRYVALITLKEQGNIQRPHRFFVIEHCLHNFDMLIGADIITNLPASVRMDEPIGSARPIRSNT
jgi:hypothetical protein